MDPNVWGPCLWDLMFTLAFKTEPNAANISDLQHLFILLEHVMPCSHCRRSYALYRKQVSPTSSITVSKHRSAALWLWTIHDMVNQKLGKICISFDRLERRHDATTFITHDLLALDVLTMIVLSVKSSIRDKAVKFVQITTRLLGRLSPFFSIDKFVRGVVFQPESIKDDFLNLHNRLYEQHGIPPLTRQQFDAKYRNAHVN